MNRKSVTRRARGLLGSDVPALVKEVSVETLVSLMNDARQHGFSGVGRPAWIERNIDDIVTVVLIPLGAESGQPRGVPAWRCYAGVVVKGRGPVVFTVDVATEAFDKLADISDPWDLAGKLLYNSFHVPIENSS